MCCLKNRLNQLLNKFTVTMHAFLMAASMWTFSLAISMRAFSLSDLMHAFSFQCVPLHLLFRCQKISAVRQLQFVHTRVGSQAPFFIACPCTQRRRVCFIFQCIGVWVLLLTGCRTWQVSYIMNSWWYMIVFYTVSSCYCRSVVYAVSSCYCTIEVGWTVEQTDECCTCHVRFKWIHAFRALQGWCRAIRVNNRWRWSGGMPQQLFKILPRNLYNLIIEVVHIFI